MMQDCWAADLTQRPLLAIVARRLQAMGQGHAKSNISSGRSAAPASVVMNPAFDNNDESTDT